MCLQLVIRRSQVRSRLSQATFFCGCWLWNCFLWSFSAFCWFRKGSCQFLAKQCAQVLVNHLEDLKPVQEKCVRWSDQLDMTLIVLTRPLNSKPMNNLLKPNWEVYFEIYVQNSTKVQPWQYTANINSVNLFSALYYGKCPKISNTLKFRTPNIFAQNNFWKCPKISNSSSFAKRGFLKFQTQLSSSNFLSAYSNFGNVLFFFSVKELGTKVVVLKAKAKRKCTQQCHNEFYAHKWHRNRILILYKLRRYWKFTRKKKRLPSQC